jgi:arylsulfatase A
MSQPELVAKLSKLYDDWYADISSAGLRRFALPVGHAEHNPVELHAPQAYFDKPLHFASGPGFANDWLTGWNDDAAKVWFDLDVVSAGTYEIELAFACPPEDAGSRVRLKAGDASLETTIPAAPIKPIPLPHRDEAGMARYRNREWATLQLGTLKLQKGPQKLTLEVLRKPGTSVVDLKHVALRKRDE